MKPLSTREPQDIFEGFIHFRITRIIDGITYQSWALNRDRISEVLAASVDYEVENIEGSMDGQNWKDLNLALLHAKALGL